MANNYVVIIYDLALLRYRLVVIRHGCWYGIFVSRLCVCGLVRISITDRIVYCCCVMQKQ